MDFRIISIGALSANEFWPSQGALRSAHATTTLVVSGGHKILVDPALPAQVLTARLTERSGLVPSDITDVFLTCFRPAHRMGLRAFDDARWLISQAEREAVGGQLVARFEQEDEGEVKDYLSSEIALLKRFEEAPDKLAANVDLFPVTGFTPGTCGLLLSQPNTTTLIAGDAVATTEHLQHGRVLKGAVDIEQAQESMREVIEIADVIVPGHDNVVTNATRRML